MKLPTDRTVFQNAWVVDDVMSAMKKWVDFYGIGPFYLLDHIQLDNLHYRGKPAPLDISVGLAQAGPVQIELIQQFNSDPSVYRDQVPEGETGFHHVCIYTHNFEADKTYFENAGYVTAMQGDAASGAVQFGYFDTRKDFGVFTEVVTPHPDFVARNDMIARAAENWDGKDPIRIVNVDGGYSTP